jgi:nicotinamide phosphoribosyltransferase
MRINPILVCDSYKESHYLQYPPNTEYVYSYIESRGGPIDKVLFFGLQIFLKEFMNNPITTEDINEAALFLEKHGEPFNREGFEYIVNEHLGFWPVEIKAYDEGSLVPTHTPLLTIVNTDPKCFWVTTFLETALLRSVWYPTTVATISWRCKQYIKEAIEKSSDDVNQIAFKLHDFGARGVSSSESAGIGGAAHLVNFMGSDTIEGVMYANKYYNADMAGFSIPAAEHSTITSWGNSFQNERDAYNNMLTQFAKPGKMVAVVSDSYDLMKAVNYFWGIELRQKVIDSGATVIIRPDSGDPLTVPIDVIKSLDVHYGHTLNSKGYKVLNNVRVIQGDGITVDTIPKIIDNLLDAGYAIDNLAFGMGGGLLQQCNRDTYKFAMKCSAVCIDGEWKDVYKAPNGDMTKASKRGIFNDVNLKEKYFSNGGISITYNTTFDEIRKRSNN